jgi:PhnB protein
MSAVSAIRAVLAARTSALRTRDADAVTRLYEPGALMFELAPPLAFTVHPERTPRGYRAWFATWDGPIHYKTKDLDIALYGRDFALAQGYVRIHGSKIDGQKIDSWYRQTLALRKSKAGWRIAHQHTSVPYLMDGSDRAALDLKPPKRRA